ncbi:hypothetical protein M433DRAFT_170203 [Acidomyces richmondensis BFW]|nr:hypothetical protein M433DRAFT_170203 [Acidomyces richmondensis BFW]
MVFASIAEMASISTSGGQYHWVSEFAPKIYHRFLSWLAGSISVLGWQIGLASLAFIVVTVIQGLIVLDDSAYVSERWQGTLLVMAVAAFAIIFNSFVAIKLPNDSAVHMSVEIKDASLTLPRVIMTSAVINGILGWVMTITFCFTLGNLLDVNQSATGHSFIQVFLNATKGRGGASVMTAIITINITSACISTVATVSRQTWSFARDGGLPFSGFLAHVMPGWKIPLNSVLITFAMTCLVSLINIRSTVAFIAIGSAALVSILSTYFFSISVLICRRFQGTLPPHRWDLGKFGLAVAWLMTVWFFGFFPLSTPVVLSSMNWNCAMYGGIIIIGLVY